MLRYLAIAGLLLVLIFEHRGSITFLPFWLEPCPATGSGSAYCVIEVPEGKALIFTIHNGGIGVYGDKGSMEMDDPFGGIDYVFAGTYNIHAEDGSWALVPREWIDLVVK